MEAPGFFVLLAIFLFLIFGACMVTGAVWLFFGWRKKSRPVQVLSALPFGVGLFIIGPLLLLAVVMVVWWLVSDWRGISQPAPPQQGTPNQRLQAPAAAPLGFHDSGNSLLPGFVLAQFPAAVPEPER